MAREKLTQEEEIKIMKELEEFDTPTITNVVATYPAMSACLGLYDPQQVNWYTDNSLRCLYPELGPRCGYAVTAVYGMVDPAFKRLEFKDVLVEIAEAEGPVILFLKENFSERMKNRNALIGGQHDDGFQAAWCGWRHWRRSGKRYRRDASVKVQCMFPGTVAGHGTAAVEAVNVPVSMCGMDVAPMEVIHVDESGAVKFPRKYLKEVLEKAKELREFDNERMARMCQTTDPLELADIMKGLYK